MSTYDLFHVLLERFRFIEPFPADVAAILLRVMLNRVEIEAVVVQPVLVVNGTTAEVAHDAADD